MNYSESRIPIYLAITFGLLAALVAGQYVSGMFGNPISAIAPLIAVGLMLWATVNHRQGLIILMVISACLDLCKRLLLVNGDIGIEDVTKVLAVAPITAVGVFLGCWLPVIVLRRRAFAAKEVLIIWIASAVLCLFIIATFVQTKDVSEVVSSAGQSGIYIFIIVIAYSLYVRSSIDDMRRLLGYILGIYLPVALYGLYQVVFGYNQLEYSYMSSGLTSTSWLLKEAYTRPFSTLNSPHAYGTMMWFCMVLAFYRMIVASNRKALWALLWLVYLVADLFSTTRGAAIISLMCLPSMYWFASKRKTIALYGSITTILALLILNARWLLDNIAWLDSFIPKTGALQQQMFNIQTFSDRLQGYVNVLGNPDAWTLFGNSSYNWSTSTDGTVYNHDLVSAILLQFGVIGVVIILGSVGTALFVTHRRILNIKSDDERKLASVLAVLMVFFLFANMFGKSFQVFPLNFYFYLFTGLLLALCFRPGSEAKSSVNYPKQAGFLPLEASKTERRAKRLGSRRRSGRPNGSMHDAGGPHIRRW